MFYSVSWLSLVLVSLASSASPGHRASSPEEDHARAAFVEGLGSIMVGCAAQDLVKARPHLRWETWYTNGKIDESKASQVLQGLTADAANLGLQLGEQYRVCYGRVVNVLVFLEGNEAATNGIFPFLVAWLQERYGSVFAEEVAMSVKADGDSEMVPILLWDTPTVRVALKYCVCHEEAQERHLLTVIMTGIDPDDLPGAAPGGIELFIVDTDQRTKNDVFTAAGLADLLKDK